MSDNSFCLIGDIGATNSRYGLVDLETFDISDIRTFKNTSYKSLNALIADYLSGCEKQSSIDQTVLAIAGPVDGRSTTMTNLNWRIDGDKIEQDFNLRSAVIINDFHALAYAVADESAIQRVEIGNSTAYRSGNRAIVGPGSGLGVACWVPHGDGGTAIAGEGGHQTIGARNAQEETVIRKIRKRYGHCSAERLLSGPGLLALYEALHDKRLNSPEQITLDPNKPENRLTIEQFLEFLGTVASDVALTTNAVGGIYIAGGIVPDMLANTDLSIFRDRFTDKGRHSALLRSIPTYVLVDSNPGLIGLTSYLKYCG